MLFNKKITPDCAYCSHRTLIGEGEVACVKKGVSQEGLTCGKFDYDPLKRVPDYVLSVPKTDLKPEDFEL